MREEFHTRMRGNVSYEYAREVIGLVIGLRSLQGDKLRLDAKALHQGTGQGTGQATTNVARQELLTLLMTKQRRKTLCGRS